MTCIGSLVAALSIAALQLAGCVVYPTSRTFYEPTATEGSLRNQTGCGYIRTRDTVERRIGDLTLAVMVGSEKEPDARHATLEVTLILAGREGSWRFNPEYLMLVLTTPPTSLRPSSATHYPSQVPRSHWIRSTLIYPEPAGLVDQVELRFEPGALALRGNAIDLAPLHFNRVKKSDFYFGSINC